MVTAVGVAGVVVAQVVVARVFVADVARAGVAHATVVPAGVAEAKVAVLPLAVGEAAIVHGLEGIVALEGVALSNGQAVELCWKKVYCLPQSFHMPRTMRLLNL